MYLCKLLFKFFQLLFLFFNSLLGKRGIATFNDSIGATQMTIHILWMCVSYPMYSADLWHISSNTLYQNKASSSSNVVMLFHSPVKNTSSKKDFSSDKYLLGCFLFLLGFKKKKPSKGGEALMVPMEGSISHSQPNFISLGKF